MTKTETNKQKDTDKPEGGKRPELQFSVMCDGAGKDKKGKLILGGVFNQLVRIGIVSQFFIANRWIYGKGKFNQTIIIHDPDHKKEIAKVEGQEFSLPHQANSADIVTGFVNVNFEKSGVYWVEILLNEKAVLTYPLPVYSGSNN